jgi:hypothetical protein
MAFCNAVRKVSNWNAGGVPLADMLLLLWWTMHFVLWEQDATSHLRCQVSKICILFRYEFQHSHSNECIIRIIILCDISTLIVPYSPYSRISNFFCKRLLFQCECRACQPVIGSAS